MLSNRILKTYLRSEIGDDNELLEYIFRQNVCVTSLLYIIAGHIDMVGSQMQIGGRYGSYTPFGFAGEGGRLVVASGSRDDFISMLTTKTQ